MSSFTILLHIQHVNNFLPARQHRQANVRRFLGICLYDCSFIYCTNFVYRKCFETRRHLGSGSKTVNSQGYSELREPVQTRKNCYSLIWKILMSIILKCVQNARNYLSNERFCMKFGLFLAEILKSEYQEISQWSPY